MLIIRDDSNRILFYVRHTPVMEQIMARVAMAAESAVTIQFVQIPIKKGSYGTEE